LLRISQSDQRIDREGRVADPGIPVIPVALSADGLRQAERGGGDDRSITAAGQQLQHQAAAVDDVYPATVIGTSADPILPVIDGTEKRLCDHLAEIVRAGGLVLGDLEDEVC